MTAKQRAKIYRQAAELVSLRYGRMCCSAIALVAFDNEWKFNKVKEMSFPEIYMFKYGTESEELWWWDIMEREPRVIALLLSEQIALNP